MVANRIKEHASGMSKASASPAKPPLVEVQGKCDFHVARVRKGVYQIRVGRSADAIVNFRCWPDYLEDIGHSKAWRRLRATLRRQTGKKEVKFQLQNLECAYKAWRLAERVGSAINGWRVGAGRADFPSAADITPMVDLPEAMVEVALRAYVRVGS